MVDVDSTRPSSYAPFTRNTIRQTIPERFEHVAAYFTNQTALTGSGKSWTYASLNRRTNKIAHGILQKAKSGTGCVAFLAEQSPEMVIATLSILKAGKIYLGIHPGMPNAAQRDIIEDATPDLILSTSNLADRAEKISTNVCQVLNMDDIDDRYPEENPKILIQSEDPSTIFYTSGSTGQPKGVVKSHNAVMHRVWLSTQHDHIVPEDRQSLLTHSSFSASESDIFGVLLQGGRLCVFDVASQGLSSFCEWIDDEKITLLHPPVILFRNLLSILEGTGLFPSVRLVALAGDVVLPEDIEKWKHHFSDSCVLLHRFSTAETALLCVAHFNRDSVPNPQFIAAGKAVADKCLKLVDEKGRSVDKGKPGEIFVQSRYLALGYWRHPEETAAVFQNAPDVPGERIYRTGDMGRLLNDGSLVFLRRREHLAKIRGYRVDTREVEFPMTKLEEVSAAAVIISEEQGQDSLIAFVVPKKEFLFDNNNFRKKLQAHLPEWKIPARIVSIPALPIMLNGKVDRQFLSKFACSTSGDQELNETDLCNFDDPFTSIEETLADIWRVALNAEEVGLDDNFLDLGGNSLSTMQILAWIERLFEIKLSPAVFFKIATIRGIAALIQDTPPASESVSSRGCQSSLPMENVADGFLKLLNRHRVDYIFVNPGTDTAPILEAVAKCNAKKERAPKLVLCLHESVGMAAAHGYFMVKGTPQVLMVHVDVGTQNIGSNLHNAQRGRAGVVICAGRAPYTVDGSVPGGRNSCNHWIQEQYSPIVAGQRYVKWYYELTRPENLQMALDRAFQFAQSEPAGPVHLTLPRETLLQRMDFSLTETKEPSLKTRVLADPEILKVAAQWLIEAENPIILTSYSGRKPETVSALVNLAEMIAAPVVESRHRLNFPSSHPLHLGFTPARYLQKADCVLVIDHDVPWIPAYSRPLSDSRVIQVDIDPLKRDIPIWGFPVDLSIKGDSELVCKALTAEVDLLLHPLDRKRLDARRQICAAEHCAMITRNEQRALKLAHSTPIAPEWAAYCLNEIIEEDMVVIGEAVTNTPILWNYLRLDVPGSYYQSMGSGLGWGPGAALGAKLACPNKLVICIMGDGAWFYSSPLAVYSAAEQYRCPFLTVIFNNHKYFAITESILGLAPSGYAQRTGIYPACDLPKPPLISKVAKALDLWSQSVCDPSELPGLLREALRQVRRGRSALIDISVSSPKPVDLMPMDDTSGQGEDNE